MTRYTLIRLLLLIMIFATTTSRAEPTSTHTVSLPVVVQPPQYYLYVYTCCSTILKFDAITGAQLTTIPVDTNWNPSLAITTNSDLYFSDGWYVRRFDRHTGKHIIPDIDLRAAGFLVAQDMTVTRDGFILIVGQWPDDTQGSIRKVGRFDPESGIYLGDLIPKLPGGCDHMEISPEDLLYLLCADSLSPFMLRANLETGQIVDIVRSPELDRTLTAFTFGPDQSLYILRHRTVTRHDSQSLELLDTLVDSEETHFNAGLELAFGHDGDLYVVDFFNGDVQRYDGKTGAYRDIFVSPTDGQPVSRVQLAFDPSP